MNTQTPNTSEASALDLYRAAVKASARAADHGRKAAWLDATRNPNAVFYCNQAEDTRQEAIRANKAWLAVASTLTGERVVAILRAA